MFCNQLNHTLSFFPEKIEGCCSGFNGPIYIDNIEMLKGDISINWQEITKYRKELIKKLKNN